MAIGPGKYDDLCTEVRERVGLGGADEMPRGGGVLVIVVGGDKGNGFSCQADLPTTMGLPNLLEMIAAQIRKDGIA